MQDQVPQDQRPISRRVLDSGVPYALLSVFSLWAGLTAYLRLSRYERGEPVDLGFVADKLFTLYTMGGAGTVLAVLLAMAALFAWVAWNRFARR